MEGRLDWRERGEEETWTERKREDRGEKWRRRGKCLERPERRFVNFLFR